MRAKNGMASCCLNTWLISISHFESFSLCDCFVFLLQAPQIWKTYHMKRVGSLSILMIGLQGGGAALTAYFFSLDADWVVWLPFVIASVLLTILFLLALYYTLQERKAEKLRMESASNLTSESTKLLSPNSFPSEDAEN